MTKRLFKVLNQNGTPCHGGSGQWHLPTGDAPGRWMPPIRGKLIACKNGYHLCHKDNLVDWLGPAIYEAETRGERQGYGNKIVVREARLLLRLDGWNKRTARLFACDCAEHVLYLYEQHYPNDDRPRYAIEVARQYANDQATHHELLAARAAGDAAWDAARAAAPAAWDAERQWQIDKLMEYLN